MSLTLRTDIASMKLRRTYTDTMSDLGDVLQRMSSGLRVSSGKDDAAAVSVANLLQVDSKVYAQGLDNVNKGINLVDTAESAVVELYNIASKISALATKSAGDGVTLEQRSALNEEAQALSKEFSRIIRTTDFNFTDLLTGTLGTVSIQASYGSNGTINGDIEGVTGTGTFDSGTVVGSDTDVYHMGQGDFNGDGNIDFVTTDRTSNDVKIMLGNGDGSFTAGSNFSIGGTGNRPDYVNVADLNNDGYLDLQTSNVFSGDISILMGNGDGTFDAATQYAASVNSYSSVIADFNGDDILDIVTTSFSGSNIQFLSGNGDGTFNSAVASTITGATNAYGIKAADFNGDGYTDLATVSSTDAEISILNGNGNGTFNLVGNYSIGSYGYYLDIGDFNNDNEYDILTASYGGTGSVQVLTGNGDSTFTKSTDIALAVGTNNVVAEDVNGDGNSDIVAVSFTDANVYVSYGDGSGVFSSMTTIGTLDQAEGIAVGDFNNDGVNDIGISGTSTNQVKVFLQNTTTGTSNLAKFDISTKGGANDLLPVLDRKLDLLSKQFSDISAFKSRLTFARDNARSAAEAAYTGSEQILNADLALEAASAIKLKMVEQTSISILAQANLQPKYVLDLMKF